MKALDQKKSSNSILCIFSVCFIFLFFAVALSHADTSESLTIITYYPSPNAVFNYLEARGKLVVGDITHSNTAQNHIDSIDDLDTGKLFVENSAIFGEQTVSPAPSHPGQVYFNGTSKKIEFYNGSWQHLGP
jgi:hypothetical protein